MSAAKASGVIKAGTASWTDKTLLASGWYPTEASTPEARLRYYAEQFPLVEVGVQVTARCRPCTWPGLG